MGLVCILVFLFGGGLSMAASTIARATMILEIYDELLEIIAWFVKKALLGTKLERNCENLQVKIFHIVETIRGERKIWYTTH